MAETTETVEFICPECGNNLLVAYQVAHEKMEMVEVIEASPKFKWLAGGEVIDTDIVDVMSYGCGACGFEIACDEGDAIEWLEKHGMLGRKTQEGE